MMLPSHLAHYLAQYPEDEAATIIAKAAELRERDRQTLTLPVGPWVWLVDLAAKHGNVRTADVLSAGKQSRRVVAVRAAVAVVLRDLEAMSYARIGEVLNRHHASVMHLYREAQGERYEPELSRLRELLVTDMLERAA